VARGGGGGGGEKEGGRSLKNAPLMWMIALGRLLFSRLSAAARSL